MIDIGKILGRAWHVLWNYRVLWIFGILVVLMGGGAASPNFRASWNNNGSYSYDGNNGGQGVHPPYKLPVFIERTNEWFDTVAQPWFEEHVAPLFATPEAIVRTIVWMVVILLAISILFWLLTSLVRYPSETAVIRMVDEYEQSGTKVGFKQGWKMGWSRQAFRLWVIDLLIGLPAMVLSLIMLGLGLGVAANAIQGHWEAITGIVFALVLTFIVLGMAVVLVSGFLQLLRPFFARKAALEGAGVGDSFRLGWAMVKGNWQSAGLMWLVMIGLGLAYVLVSIFLIIALIPVLVVTALAGVIVAAIPAALAFWIASLSSIAPIAWIVAILVGMPFFLLLMTSPQLLIGGWVHVFTSSIWTLTYREIKVLENLKPVVAAPTKA
jgi:hypothetical protein